jgi:oxaloacetate decarboxylase beta subunit
MAKLLNLFSRNKINPLIGSAGVSAVPMAAGVEQGGSGVGRAELPADARDGPERGGVIGSAIAAGVMLKYVLAM